MSFKGWFFDLDDTLYPELEFVHSGFRAVAADLQSRYGINEGEVLQFMLKSLSNEGRGRVFDHLISEFDLADHVTPRSLVHLYRTHEPEIRLHEESIDVLRKLRNRSALIAVITDGMGSVQQRKLRALGLEKMTDLCLATDELGSDFWKPSTEPFRVACELLQLAPSECCYIGDNPRKDFEGANRLGMTTFRFAADWCQFRSEPDASEAIAAPVHCITSLCDVLETK